MGRGEVRRVRSEVSLPDPAPNTTVLVTGASSGIGADLARELASRGHGLTLVARRKTRLRQLARELRADHGVKVTVEACDLVDDADRAALADRVLAGRRRVVGLCNNAGQWSMGALAEADPAQEATVVRLNALALHDLTVRLLPSFVEAGRGAVLNVASINGFQPLPGNATYAATKAFVISLSEALHSELVGTGVSCTVVSPGPTRTEVFELDTSPDPEELGPGVFWSDADDVARKAVDAMEDGRRTLVPGLANKLAALYGRFTPRTVLLPLVRQFSPLLR